MTQKIYVVEGRQFRTETDYNRALHDKKIIDSLRIKASGYSISQLRQLREEVHSGKYKFLTLLGQDFEDELEEMISKAAPSGTQKKTSKKVSSKVSNREVSGKNVKKQPDKSNAVKKETLSKEEKLAKAANPAKKETLDEATKEELRRLEKRRKYLVVLCSVVGVICLCYVGMYSYFEHKANDDYEALSDLKEKDPIMQETEEATVQFTRDEPQNKTKEVLDEYKNLLNKNKKLIGWVKIDDTNIDYPVMQTSDNEYYLKHNIDQEYDKNGSIFMDKDCDVLKPSTNFIVYGHHMKSGKMFGHLDKYSDQKFYEEHPYIQFDTIYEKGTYQIMYVFRSRVYNEEEIVFKYYQFIDALSEKEFDSYMQEMATLSLYDTGVTAKYGDQLLTLSTCDYEEKNGRFVVVAKKVTKE